jgi:hypothetical protein
MGIRVNAQTLRRQLEISGQLDFLQFPYHHAITKHEIPLSIGGGIGQSRSMMLVLRKAHRGEVTVSVWPNILKQICAKKNINALEQQTERVKTAGSRLVWRNARGGGCPHYFRGSAIGTAAFRREGRAMRSPHPRPVSS